MNFWLHQYSLYLITLLCKRNTITVLCMTTFYFTKLRKLAFKDNMPDWLSRLLLVTLIAACILRSKIGPTTNQRCKRGRQRKYYCHNSKLCSWNDCETGASVSQRFTAVNCFSQIMFFDHNSYVSLWDIGPIPELYYNACIRWIGD